VLNFKKSVDRRGYPEWRHKERSIIEVAQAFGVAIDASWLMEATLVPIPPSKAKSDPLYDDRIVRMLHAIPAQAPLHIRELIVQRQSMTAAHDADVRPTPDDIAAGYCIDEMLADPAPTTIGIFDDVITTGAHYIGARRVLAARFPGAAIFGLFIARRVPGTMDFNDLFGELN
jgi:predicted amidophosphoribosyltransferase